jgi:DNA-binding LacI/PurR family transcriptional regulator
MGKSAGTRSARVRLEDVAREAGVSKSIASRILSGYPDLAVRPETQERVFAAAAALRYLPHAGARSLKRAGVGALGLLVPPLTNPAYIRILRGAYHRALERDTVILLAEDFDAQQADETFARLVQAGRIDGLIVASARPRHPLLSSLRRRPVPHVFVNRAVAGSGRNVVMDDARASRAALDHLVGLGHRRVGHVAGPRNLDPARRRAVSFSDHATRLGLEQAAVAQREFSEAGGADAARVLLARRPRATALFTSSLSQGVGTLHGAAELGLAVPGDLSVVSYDDMPLAAYLRPPLTTVRMPLAEMGAAAVDALLDQLAGEPPRDVLVATAPEVVVRSSTAPP